MEGHVRHLGTKLHILATLFASLREGRHNTMERKKILFASSQLFARASRTVLPQLNAIF